MRFQFQLRTPFLVLTTVAVSVGLGIVRLDLIGSPKLDGGWLDANLSVTAWWKVPYSVVAVMGIKWILEQKKPRTTTNLLVLYALALNLIWHLLVSWFLSYLVRINISNTSLQFFMHSLNGLVSELVNAICWLLMILAYLRVIAKKTA